MSDVSFDDFMKPKDGAPKTAPAQFLSPDEFMKSTEQQVPQPERIQSMTVTGKTEAPYEPSIIPLKRTEPGKGMLGSSYAYTPSALTKSIQETFTAPRRSITDPNFDPVKEGQEAGMMLAGGNAVPGAARGAGVAAKVLPDVAEKAASTGGKAIRGVATNVDDLMTSMREGAKQQAKADAAKAPPTADTLIKARDAAYAEAFKDGAVMKPEEFGKFVDKDLGEVITQNRIKFKDTLTPQTKAMHDNLEDYRGKDLKLEDLDDMMKENRDFVSKAASDAKNTNVRTDLRSAQILSKAIRDFVYKWEPEGAGAALQRGKELARRTIKMRQVEEIMDVADRLKDPSELKSAFRAIAKDQLEYSNFSPAEQKIINEIAAESPTRDIVGTVPLGKTALKAKDAYSRVTGADLKKAKEMLDLIARGEAAQNDAAANAVKNPGFSGTIKRTLQEGGRPQGPQSPEGLYKL